MIDKSVVVVYTGRPQIGGDALSLRKSPTFTPALLAANRRNAQKSTGPSTRQGKAQSCLNRLKAGERSRVYRGLWLGLLHARPGAVARMADLLLTREQAAHPLFAEVVDLAVWAEDMVSANERFLRELAAARRARMSGENADQGIVEVEAESAAKSRYQVAGVGKESAPPGKEQRKKMFDHVQSRKVIGNTRNNDIMSCYSTDILGNLTPVLTGKAQLGATNITFGMRFRRQCWAVATPRYEPESSECPAVERHGRVTEGARFDW